MKQTIIPMALAMIAASCSPSGSDKGEIIDKTGWMPADRQYTTEVLSAEWERPSLALTAKYFTAYLMKA